MEDKNNIKCDIRKKAKVVKLLIMDVDGVMTNGRIIFDNDGRELKFFDVRDGHGIKLLMRGGVDVAIITSRESSVVLKRANDLGIKIVSQGAIDKISSFEKIIAMKGLSPEDVAYIGDDLVDIPLLKRVGFSIAVSDAVEEVKGCADYVTEKRGGRGAVREICELILKTRGIWKDVVSRYIER